ncbi:hypothetical protein TRFO_25032 [Tritrichomonas foetus]|uniref:Uncharacterized protein n=1 Tax=Tritrichomonas foetus TaxID=1144522 RepID=A0A1J4K783_9EUKA|nr:hypothetical protein TRFO_25032 [Tritrichomonas foetus]|eukprot:OHT06858.1 hypothetical protein TRFO_25032 [Tritrichomonas foetus]
MKGNARKKAPPQLKLVLASDTDDGLDRFQRQALACFDNFDSSSDDGSVQIIETGDPLLEMLDSVQNIETKEITNKPGIRNSKKKTSTFESSQPNNQTTKPTSHKTYSKISPEFNQSSNPKPEIQTTNLKPDNNKKPRQRKIFEFGNVSDLPPEDEDDFFSTVQSIYTFFNRKRPIPLIIAAIHQSAGDVYEAVHRIAAEAYDYTEGDADLSYASIAASPDLLCNYFACKDP